MNKLYAALYSTLLSLSLLGNFSFARSTSQPSVSLRAADVHPEDYPTVQALQFIHRQISKESGGKLGLQIFAAGILGDEAPLLTLTQSGELDLNRVSAQALDGISPLTRVLSLPYLFRDIEHQHQVLDGPIGREILDSLSQHALIGLAFYDAGLRNIYTSKQPVRTLEDMKGLHIRVQTSALAAASFEALGAKTVKLPYSQTGHALSNGLINAAENNLPSYRSTAHYQHAPFYSYTRHSATPEVLVISSQSWGKLTAAQQEMLRNAAQASVPVMRQLWQERETREEASLRQAGVRFSELAPGELQRFMAALSPVYSRFTGSPQQQDLIRRIRTTK